MSDVTLVPVATEQTPLPYSVIAVSNENPNAKALVAMFRHEDDRERFISGRSFTDADLRARDERIIAESHQRWFRYRAVPASDVVDAIIAAAEADA